MCPQCNPLHPPVELDFTPLDPAPRHTRPVPYGSGEGAIYTPEYLARKEGNRLGTLPDLWRNMYVPEGM